MRNANRLSVLEWCVFTANAYAICATTMAYRVSRRDIEMADGCYLRLPIFSFVVLFMGSFHSILFDIVRCHVPFLTLSGDVKKKHNFFYIFIGSRKNARKKWLEGWNYFSLFLYLLPHRKGWLVLYRIWKNCLPRNSFLPLLWFGWKVYRKSLLVEESCVILNFEYL